ncbi:MAG TPA: DNA repair protein RecO [Gemmatimonadaceae bacterium]|nr:DNA repair protein RecO [Gemmatimonadaceae bacterium]
MPLLVSEAIVLHAFDYLESSRIVRLVTRDAGMRSGLAKGARKSHRRFGSGLDLFAQGTAFLHTRPGRELDTLSGFEDVRTRTPLASDLERFHGAEAVAEIILLFGREGADADLFDATSTALDALAAPGTRDAREVTLAAIWQIVATLGFAAEVDACVECGSDLDPTEPALFSHSAGGTLCARCAALAPGGRRVPAAAREAIAMWMRGEGLDVFTDADARAHQRLLREFLTYHLHDGRALRAYEQWERGIWSGDGSAA